MQPEETKPVEPADFQPAAEADGYYGDEGGDDEVDLSFLDEQKTE